MFIQAGLFYFTLHSFVFHAEVLLAGWVVTVHCTFVRNQKKNKNRESNTEENEDQIECAKLFHDLLIYNLRHENC